ncbi:hypothetical protein D7X94_14800 [Acutalibacter sp. 1XD8-33]|nr:hypothetical protein D7X94_14800 [Acutalibacter sp. 1XD8-33]
MEVCPLSRGIMLSNILRFNPYPPHYRAAFAFSMFLYPHPHRHTLRWAFPRIAGRIRAYHVPHN